MQPTKSEVHVDVVLTAMAIKYMQRMANFIAGAVFPIVRVSKSSDKYRIWTKGDWFRDEARLRPPGTPAVRSGYTMSTEPYTCDEYALAKEIADGLRRDADADVNLDQGAVNFVMQRLMLRREIQWVADFFATGKWATDKAVDNKWNAYDASTPIDDIETGKATILASTGFEPNKLVVGYEVWRYLKNHPEIIDRLGMGGSARETRVVTREAVAAILELDEIHVARAVKNTAAEGASDAMSLVHGKNALLCYAPMSTTTEEPSAAYTFGLGDGVDGGVPGLVIKRKRDDIAECDLVEGQLAWDNKITGTDCGYFFTSVVD